MPPKCRLYVGRLKLFSYRDFIIYLYLFRFVSYLGGMVSPCRYPQSSNKRINVEGCKNTIGSEPINKNEHKAVKQHSGPTIYLGKDNESKYSSLCRTMEL